MAKIFSIKILVLLWKEEGKLWGKIGIYLTDGRGCLVVLPLSAL